MFLRNVFLIFVLTACNKIPSDPGKSYEIARNIGLSAGYAVNPPWVTEKDSTAGGIEGDFINEFARQNGLKVYWYSGSEQKLMKMLENKELHIVISGFMKDNPWKSKKTGFTLPYYKMKKEKHVIAVQQGENNLMMKLELYLNSKKDSINTIINAYKQKL